MNLASQIKAAAWRENPGGYRDRPKPEGDREGAFDQLDVPGPDEDPVKTLEAILAAAAQHADGIECASLGELAAARAAGARRLAFSCPVKTPADTAASA